MELAGVLRRRHGRFRATPARRVSSIGPGRWAVHWPRGNRVPSAGWRAGRGADPEGGETTAEDERSRELPRAILYTVNDIAAGGCRQRVGRSR